jgi:hypothetical protein
MISKASVPWPAKMCGWSYLHSSGKNKDNTCWKLANVDGSQERKYRKIKR